jgi:hypothetical protein
MKSGPAPDGKLVSGTTHCARAPAQNKKRRNAINLAQGIFFKNSPFLPQSVSFSQKSKERMLENNRFSQAN